MKSVSELLDRLIGMSGVAYSQVNRLGIDAVTGRLEARGPTLPIEIWRVAAAGLPDASRVVENPEARAALDEGYSLWLEQKPEWTKTDLFGDGNAIGLLGRIENNLRDIQANGDEIAAKLGSIDPAQPMPIVTALGDLDVAWAYMLKAAEEAKKALQAVWDTEPRGPDALGLPLGQKISGGRGEFKSFANAAQEAWHHCGEVLKGEGSYFEHFLDRMHEAVVGRAIPSRGQLLGKIRSQYGSAAPLKRWK